MDVNSYHHNPATLLPEKGPQYPAVGGWMYPPSWSGHMVKRQICVTVKNPVTQPSSLVVY